jgi:bromodomain adjacent to zinc finger domain protein 1A
MINVISSESIRVTGTLHATATSAALPIFANQEGADGMTAEEQELVARKALEYARGWDRGAKLKSAEGREGWERHLIGLLCQRGGIETMPELPRILRHLLYGSSDPMKPESEGSGSGSGSESGASGIEADPEEQYLTLPIEDKLAIIGFLSELVLSSKFVRGYIDDCEAELTDLRKERIEINREKKALYVDALSVFACPTYLMLRFCYRIADNLALSGKKPVVKAEGADGDTPMDDANPTNPAESSPPVEAQSSVDEVDSMALDQPPTNGVDTAEQQQKHNSDSEFDELESSHGTPATEPDAGPSIAPGSRRIALREKQLKREAEAAARARARESEKTKHVTPKNRKQTNDEELARLTKRGEELEREFRKYRDVARVSPLGRDRFYNRYYYFDGSVWIPFFFFLVTF